MTAWVRRIGGLGVAWAAAALWAYGMTVLQPLNEAGSPYFDGSLGNNTYWAREVRWAAILAGVAALIVVTRRPLRIGVLAGVWLAADLVLDRIGVHSGALWPAALIAVAVVSAASVLPAADQHRRAVTTVMALCAATAPVLATIESPTNAEPQLAPSRAAAVTVLVLAALVAAWAAAPALTVLRVACGVLLGAGVVLATQGWSSASWLAGCAFLAGLWLLCRSWAGWNTAAVGLLLTLVAYPVLFYTALYLDWAAGTPFTALAGNPAINAADEDSLRVLAGLLIGAAFSVFPLLFSRVPDYSAALKSPNPGT
jgi:hypothetical protein